MSALKDSLSNKTTPVSSSELFNLVESVLGNKLSTEQTTRIKLNFYEWTITECT
jgi:hypothetical protein